ncbi:MAG: oligosaccharide flippase family protein [Patescibacteria group bacterium]
MNTLRGLTSWPIRVLRWSERYTKTDMLYLVSGSFWYIVGQVVASLSALALAIAFANLVPPEVYGTYKYILSLAGIFAIVSLPGINTAIARAVARGHDSVVHTATRSRVVHACVGSIIALAGSAYYLLKGNVELSLALLVIAAALPLFDTLTSYLFYFVGKRRFDLRTKYYAATQVISVFALVGTLLVTDNLIFILLAYFIPLTLVRAAQYLYVVRTIPRTHTEEDGDTIRYGKHLTAMQVLGMVAGEIDKVLIWKFLGPAQVAIYTFALAIPEQFKGPLKGIGELAFPKFAAQTPEQIRENLPALWRKIALYALGLLGLSLIYVAAAPYLFALVFPQYVMSVSYSQLYALALITNVASIPIAIFSAQQKTALQYTLSNIQPVIAIGLFVVLIPTYGIMGAIVASLISKCVTAASYLGALYFIR